MSCSQVERDGQDRSSPLGLLVIPLIVLLTLTGFASHDVLMGVVSLVALIGSLGVEDRREERKRTVVISALLIVAAGQEGPLPSSADRTMLWNGLSSPPRGLVFASFGAR